MESVSVIQVIVQGGALALLTVILFWWRQDHRRSMDRLETVIDHSDTYIRSLMTQTQELVLRDIRSREHLTSALQERPCLMRDSSIMGKAQGASHGSS
jgi:hypothetical protein